MLILRVGENIEKRNKSNEQTVYVINSAGDKEQINIFEVCDVYVRGAQIDGIKQYLGEDMWGGVLRIKIENWNIEEYRDILYRYLEDMAESKNIFIIDELDMLDATFKKISKVASAVYDCRDIKEKDYRSFDLANFILSNTDKDRKRKAWILYMDLLKTEPIESIIGAINYKLKTRRSAGDEQQFYEGLYSIAMSHDGKHDAEVDLEKRILNL